MYTLKMWDECGSEETVECEDIPSDRDIKDHCEDWVGDGEWGEDGAAIDCRWRLLDGDGDEVDSGIHEVEIEPDHEALIEAAGGDNDCDHDWTAEGEGGCDENPGVWSTGGTSLVFARHCSVCGLRRVERTTGSQKNPGEHDQVVYSLPDEA